MIYYLQKCEAEAKKGVTVDLSKGLCIRATKKRKKSFELRYEILEVLFTELRCFRSSKRVNANCANSTNRTKINLPLFRAIKLIYHLNRLDSVDLVCK